MRALAQFKKQFMAAGATQFGSGWAWLVKTSDGKVAITKTPNAETPLHTQGQVRADLGRLLCKWQVRTEDCRVSQTPLLTMDVWEVSEQSLLP